MTKYTKKSLAEYRKSKLNKKPINIDIESSYNEDLNISSNTSAIKQQSIVNSIQMNEQGACYNN